VCRLPIDASRSCLVKERYPAWLHDYISSDTFTLETVSLIMDVGIYFAETLRHRNPILKWALLQLPSSDIAYHQPVVVPFLGDIYLFPFLIVYNVAGKHTRGKNAAEEWLCCTNIEPLL